MNAIDVTCPTCDAQPGDECRDDQGTLRIDGWPFFHRDRIIAANAETPIVVEDPDANPVMAGLRSLMRATGYGAQADKLVAPEGKGKA